MKIVRRKFNIHCHNIESEIIVFIRPSVKLVSSNTIEFSAEDKEAVTKIAETISAMAKGGIKFEICLFAAELLGVERSSILPEIKQVENGWISLVGDTSIWGMV